MKKVILLTLLICLGTANSQWVSNYWGSSTEDDNVLNAKGLAVDVDNTGNCYVAGYVFDANTGNDIVIIKYDVEGDTLWTSSYNGNANSEDKAFGIIADDLGNIYVTGEISIVGRSYELFVMKYTSDGEFKWIKTYGATSQNLEDKGLAITSDITGDIYVTGFVTNNDGSTDIIVRKYSPNGNVIFSKTEDGQYNMDSEGNSIAVDDNERVYVTGYTTTPDNSTDIITLKYNQNGNLQWSKTIDGPGSETDKAFGIVVDENDNIYISGYLTQSNNDSNSLAVIRKYSPTGSVVWTDTYDGSGNQSTDKAFGLVVDTANDMIYLAGQTKVASNKLDYLAIKYTLSGTRKWVQTYNGPGDGDDIANAVAMLQNNKIVITGQSWGVNSNFDYATVKFNKNGNINGISRYSMSGNSDDIAKDVAVSKTEDHNIYVTGYSELVIDGSQNSYCISTVMIQNEKDDAETNPEIPSKFNLYQNYPNPFNPSTTIKFDLSKSSNVKIIIYDMLGKVVETLVNQNMEAGNYSIAYTPKNLASGIYFYQFTAGEFQDIKKMTLVK